MAADPKPLLSICIPTYNRAKFLRVMLQALLPQVADCGSEVEVWVLNNASTDDTLQILEESRGLGAFRIKNQAVNIGPTRNIVDGPQTCAQGEYTWILGDHNLLRPNGLQCVLDRLKKNQSFDVHYVNYRAANYPDQWPVDALEGFDGPFSYIGNPEVQDGPISHWYELLRPISAACTQNYVHIVRTRIWRDFWQNIKISSDYTSALTTYPHTMTLIETQLKSPTMVLSVPCFTIFNGAQSWGQPATRIKVYFKGLSELLHSLENKNLPESVLKQLWMDFFYPESAKVVYEAFTKLGCFQGTAVVIQHLGFRKRNWFAFIKGFLRYLFPYLYRKTTETTNYRFYYRGWYIYNCRPVRWLRRLTERSR